MPFIKSFTSKCRVKLISTIILLGKIMPSCSCYIKRRLLYIAIIALFSRQPSFCTKCIYANMRTSYNVYLIFNAEYMFFIYLINF